MFKVIIVNGYPRSGKDTFVEFLTDLSVVDVIEHSTISFSKYIAELMGWNGIKTIHSREMLSELKAFGNKWFDKSFKDMTSLIQYHHNQDTIIVFHIREPKEILRVVEWCERRRVEVTTVFVDGVRSEKDQSNESDLNVESYKYDLCLYNNGTLEEYKHSIKHLLSELYK